MNLLNHLLIAVALCLIPIEMNTSNVIFALLFSYLFGVLIPDIDHKFSKKPWYRKRTFVQEPLGFLLIGLPTAFLLSSLNKTFFNFVVIPYLTHIILDYLCVFETYPLAPLLKIKKKEGLGIFIPDDLFVRHEDSKKWARRVKIKKIRGISENYFTIFALLLLIFILLIKI